MPSPPPKAAFYGEWYDMTPKDRQLALLRLADRIEEHAEELVKIESENVGKPYEVTMAEEIPPIVDNLRFFAGAARMLEGRSAGEYMAGFTSFVRREPIGVAGLIAPWNYPLMMAVWKIGPALATGNTIVLKPQRANAAHRDQDGGARRRPVPTRCVQRGDR